MRRVALLQTAAIVGALVAFARLGEADGPPAPLPAPPLVLTVTPGAAGGPWRMRVENTGDVPARVAADPRLLALEITPAAPDIATAKKKELRCALPEGARPQTDEGKELVIPGKRSWSASFDPIFYCFGAKERAALAPGAEVVARFGWTPTKAAKTPAPLFVAAPVGAAVGKLAPAKEIVSAPLALSDDVTAPPPAITEDEEKPTLSLSTPESLDVARGGEISVTISLQNDGDRAATLLFRPQVLWFGVSGPQGSVKCGTPGRSVASPIRELFSTLAPKGRAHLSLLLSAVCPADTFDEPGIYRVTPHLDTTNASGRKVGVESWDGEVHGRSPTLLRVQTPRREAGAARPKLD